MLQIKNKLLIPAQVTSNGAFFFYNPTVVASAIQYSAYFFLTN